MANAVKKIPSLSPEGFVAAIADKVNRAMMYFYVSQYSQTTLYKGSVRPLAWLVAQYGNNPEQIRSRLETVLQDYFDRNFQGSIVTVQTDVTDDSINLKLTVIVRDNDVEYSLGHVIRTSNAKVLDIFDINNDGYVLSNHQNTIIS